MWFYKPDEVQYELDGVWTKTTVNLNQTNRYEKKEDITDVSVQLLYSGQFVAREHWT